MAGLSPAEAILLLTTLGSSVRWWIERRDARSALSDAKKAAEKTVDTLTATIAEKNEEIEELKADCASWQHRAEHLESLLYARGAG